VLGRDDVRATSVASRARSYAETPHGHECGNARLTARALTTVVRATRSRDRPPQRHRDVPHPRAAPCVTSTPTDRRRRDECDGGQRHAAPPAICSHYSSRATAQGCRLTIRRQRARASNTTIVAASLMTVDRLVEAARCRDRPLRRTPALLCLCASRNSADPHAPTDRWRERRRT
jgi:hypothetical protein